jgi:hypothetical protein
VNKDEVVKKHISLSFDFIRYLVKNPGMLDRLPDTADVEFLETDLPISISEEVLPARNQGVLFKVEHSFEEVAQDG